MNGPYRTPPPPPQAPWHATLWSRRLLIAWSASAGALVALHLGPWTAPRVWAYASGLCAWALVIGAAWRHWARFSRHLWVPLILLNALATDARLVAAGDYGWGAVETITSAILLVVAWPARTGRS